MALLASPVQAVVDAVSEAAHANVGRPPAQRASGDRLGDDYVRAACAATADPVAAMLGLSYALDPAALERHPMLAIALQGVKRPRVRADILGPPMLRGSPDALLHFAFAATLALAAGPEAAAWMGLQKELSDADAKERGRGSGFNFAEVAANLAGIEFARTLRDRGALDACAHGFAGGSVVPPLEALRSSLTRTELERLWGGVESRRFRRERERLSRLVRDWPRKAGAS